MLKGRERAYLMAQAASLDVILTVGKSGVTGNVTAEAENALRARELVKGRVLDACPLSSKEALAVLAAACGAEAVQAIGSKFVLYRENPEIPEEKRIKRSK